MQRIHAHWKISHISKGGRLEDICCCQVARAMIALLQTLQNAHMRTDDHIEFLSRNNWIWGLDCSTDLMGTSLHPFLNDLVCPKLSSQAEMTL